MSFIKNLQQKPENEKKKILLVLSIVASAIVLVLWIINMRQLFPAGTTQTPENSETESIADILRNGFKETSGVLRGTREDISASLTEISEVIQIANKQAEEAGALTE